MKTIALTAFVLFGLAAPVHAEDAAPHLTPQQREELRKTARQTAQEMKRLMSDFKAIYGELKTAMEEEGLMTPDGRIAPAAGTGDVIGKADVYDDKKFMIVQIDMPGVDKDQLKIRLKDSLVLEIEAERKEPKLSADIDVVRAERARGNFQRSIKLPYKAAEKGIDAKLENGVLTVRIPKDLKEIRKQVREIEVS